MPLFGKLAVMVVGTLGWAAVLASWHQPRAQLAPTPLVAEALRHLHADFSSGGSGKVRSAWHTCSGLASQSRDGDAAERCLVYACGARSLGFSQESGKGLSSAPWMTAEIDEPALFRLLDVMGVPVRLRTSYLSLFDRWARESEAAARGRDRPPGERFGAVDGNPYPPVVARGAADGAGGLGDVSKAPTPRYSFRPGLVGRGQDDGGPRPFGIPKVSDAPDAPRAIDPGPTGPRAGMGGWAGYPVYSPWSPTQPYSGPGGTGGRSAYPANPPGFQPGNVDPRWRGGAVANPDWRGGAVANPDWRGGGAANPDWRGGAVANPGWRGGGLAGSGTVPGSVTRYPAPGGPWTGIADGAPYRAGSPPGYSHSPDRPASDLSEIPLQQRGGDLMVPVVLNNTLTLKFQIDSGSSDVSVSRGVVSMLMRSGTLDRSDFLGKQMYTLADGSTVSNETFRLHALRVGDREMRDVTCSVGSEDGGLLLGQSFLQRFKSWSIDNRRRMLVLN